jgi:hypothetical protein
MILAIATFALAFAAVPATFAGAAYLADRIS